MEDDRNRQKAVATLLRHDGIAEGVDVPGDGWAGSKSSYEASGQLNASHCLAMSLPRRCRLLRRFHAMPNWDASANIW